ncbi:MAG TPA: hypothetical protein DCQ36_05365, partial [Actinobacteria bacterium]|nr:hypothetical protein [Actinomycetota bacterium]
MGRRALLLDWLLVLVISILTARFSGAERWTGFNSPDSEFYASLALFGDEVVSRSEPAYTWTRLGYIAPVRFLVTTVDPWLGFEIWRVLLVVIIVGSVYALVRMQSTWQLASLMGAFVGLNTVVLSYVGNSYLTGTVIAAVLLLVLLGAWPVLGSPRWPWLTVLLSGMVAAWLVMTNPYGLLLGLSMWIGLRAMRLVVDETARWRHLLQDVAIAVAGSAVVFVMFLIAGLAIFRGRNWFDTYLTWNSQLDYASFIGDATTWQRDIALLVPLLAIAVAIVGAVSTRWSRGAVAALVVAVMSIAFTVAYYLLVPGPWLESPTYVAKLWPGALAAIAITFGAVAGPRGIGWPGFLVGAASVPLVIWSGHWSIHLPYAVGLLIGALVLGLVIVAARISRGGRPVAAGVAISVALGSLAIGAQLLQNGRGLLGTYGQFPFRGAYEDFNIEMLMRSKVTAEEFVLANTSSGEKVMIWTDPDRLTAGIAGMQLWGWYNNVPEGAALSKEGADVLAQQRPDAIALYAPQ